MSRLRVFFVTLIACLVAAGVTALLDIVLSAWRAGEETTFAAFLLALDAALALYAVVGVCAGVVAGTVAQSIASTFSPAQAWRRWRQALRQNPAQDQDYAAGILAAGLTAAWLAIVVSTYLRLVGLEMASRRNTAVSTGLVAAAALPLLVLAWFPCFRALRPVAGLIPRPRAALTLAGLGAGALVVCLAALFSVDWRIINFGPFLVAGLFVAVAILYAWASYGIGRAWRQRISLALRRTLVVGLVLVFAFAAFVTWTRFGEDARSRTLVAEESSGARPLLRLAYRLLDRDGDGYAGRLGGGDCREGDPAIEPGAVDVPGDGIDQDCSGEDAVAPSAIKPKAAPSAAAARFRFDGNLLIVTVDSLRTDRVSPERMPNLAAYAKDAVVFENVYAQAPNTPRSFPSILTGRYPSHVRWARQNANFSPILPENISFFSLLKQSGLRVVGIFSHFYMAPQMGITQGFDEWDNAGALTLHDSNTDVAAPRITPRVIAKLEELARAKTRFVLWTHYFEPHSRYMEHAEFPIRSRGLKGLEEKYDGEVSFVDQHLGRVFAALRSTGLEGNTAVIVFSDHGEAFGEHRFGGELMFFHGQTLYDELLRVPLIVHLPGVPHRTVSAYAMLIDLAPTVLEMMGVTPGPSFEGRSLLGAILGDPLPDAPVYAELLPCPSWNHSWRALIRDGRKLIDKITENSIELYDLRVDPKEQHNLAQRMPSEAVMLKSALRQMMTP